MSVTGAENIKTDSFAAYRILNYDAVGHFARNGANAGPFREKRFDLCEQKILLFLSSVLLFIDSLPLFLQLIVELEVRNGCRRQIFRYRIAGNMGNVAIGCFQIQLEVAAEFRRFVLNNMIVPECYQSFDLGCAFIFIPQEVLGNQVVGAATKTDTNVTVVQPRIVQNFQIVTGLGFVVVRDTVFPIIPLFPEGGLCLKQGQMPICEQEQTVRVTCQEGVIL